MEQGTVKGLKIAGIILGVGVTAGLVLAVTTPTAMKVNGSGPLDALPQTATVQSDTMGIPMEVPPQDLIPLHPSQSLAGGYGPVPMDEWVSPVDASVAEPLAEVYPVEQDLTEAAFSGAQDDLAATPGDAAALAAQAASAAAADVRAQEDAVSTPETALVDVSGPRATIAIN